MDILSSPLEKFSWKITFLLPTIYIHICQKDPNGLEEKITMFGAKRIQIHGRHLDQEVYKNMI